MYEEITDAFVIKAIIEYETWTAFINTQIHQTTRQLIDFSTQKNKNEIIMAAAMPGKKEKYGKTYSNPHEIDLLETLEHYQKTMEEQRRLLLNRIRNLREKIDTIQRINACYNVLSEEEQKIIRLLYEGGKSYTKGMLEAQEVFHLSESSILRLRKKAFKHIHELYAAPITTMEIYHVDSMIGYKKNYR